MKCYTFTHGAIRDGISTVNDKKFGTVVFLGAVGSGCRFRKISLDKRDPAEVRNGLMKFAAPSIIMVKKEESEQNVEFPVLARPKKNKRMCLVRVNTSMPDKILSGLWEPLNGDPQLITSAWGCDKLDEREQDTFHYKWCDDLVVLNSLESIVVSIDFQSDKEEEKYVLYNDGGQLVCVDYEEYEASQKPKEPVKPKARKEIQEPVLS